MGEDGHEVLQQNIILPEYLESSSEQKILKLLKEFDLSIKFLEDENTELKNYLKLNSSLIIKGDYTPSFTSPAEPHIIIESGASLCALAIMINSDGFAASIHKPVIVGLPEEKIAVKAKEIALELLNTHPNNTRKNLTILTGLNVYPNSPKTLQSRNLVAETVQESLPENHEFISIFRKPLSRFDNIRYITGFAFIPKQLSDKGKNELFLSLNTNILG